jgi:MATE family multidrug resistance protein
MSAMSSVSPSSNNRDSSSSNYPSDVEQLIVERTEKAVIKEENNEENELFGLNEDSSSFDLLKVLWSQALPEMISFLLWIGVSFINIYFAGRYTLNGKKSTVIAGVCLANMFANVSCRSVLVGMTSAVETLASQHNGAKNYSEVGIIMQRSCWILLAFSLPTGFLWLFSYQFFSSFGVETAVCEVAQRYLSIRLWSIPVDALCFSYDKYLMAMGVMKPGAWANVLCVISIFILDYLFVCVLKLPYDCLAWAWNISLLLTVVAQYYFSLSYEEVKRTLQPFDIRGFHNWGEFIWLALPGAIMLCGEWWAFEVLSIFASFLGTAEVASQSLLVQISSFSYMIPLGLGVATTTLIGNAIGAELLSLAKRTIRVSLVCILFIEVFVSLSIYFGGSTFVRIFTSDEEVLQAAGRAMTAIALFTIFDGIQCIAGSALKGSGKQFIGAIANLGAFYVVGLPLSWLFCFHFHLGQSGLFLGLTCGVGIQLIVTTSCIFIFEDYLFTASLRTKEFELVRSEEPVDEVGDVLHMLEMVDDKLEKGQLSVEMSPVLASTLNREKESS